MVKRDKFGRFVKGHKCPEDWKQSVSDNNTGYKHTEEAKAKISLKTKGMNNPYYGKKHSLKIRQKIKEAIKGKCIGATKERREEMKTTMLGKNNPNWKGGYHLWYQALRRTERYKRLRNSVFRRDDYTCQFCYEKGKYNEIHHIRRVKDRKDLIFDIHNCITLCKDCHQKTKFKESSYQVFCDWIIQIKNNLSLGGD